MGNTITRSDGLGEPVTAAATAAAAPIVATIVKIVSSLAPIALKVVSGKKKQGSNTQNNQENQNNQQTVLGPQYPGQHQPVPVQPANPANKNMNYLLLGGGALAIYLLMQ